MRFLVCGLLPLLITICLIGFVYHWSLANSTERPRGDPKELEKTASVWLRSAGVLALIWLPLAAVYFEDNILRYAPRTVRDSTR